MINRGKRTATTAAVAILAVLTGCSDPVPLRSDPAENSPTATHRGTGPASARAAFNDALEKATSADWSNYVWESVFVYNDKITATKVIDVDLRKELMHVVSRVDAPADLRDPRAPVDPQLVFTPDAVYMSTPLSADDPRRGTWVKVTEANRRQYDIPPVAGTVSALPVGLEEFEASSIDGNFIEGTVSAEVGITLMGASELLSDPFIVASLKGRFRATVALHPTSGRIAYIEIDGEHHTVSASSKQYPRALFNSILTLSSGSVSFSDPTPVDIHVPTGAEIVKD